MRIFIAALLPQEIRDRVGEYIDGLKPSVEGVKWEKADKLHMTLKFLGSADERAVEGVSEVVRNLCLNYSPFKFTTTRLGGFPNLEIPRVLYIGLSENEGLSALQSDINRELETLGFNKEARRFIPHVTAGRVKKGFKINSGLPIAEKIDFEISQVGVIKSELNPKGSVYTPLKVFDLAD